MPRGIKRLGYRAQVPVSQESQAEHWQGFTFTGGPWQVIYRGPWGSWQVWASSEAEGRRVLEHACAAASVDPLDPLGSLSDNLSTTQPGSLRVAGQCRASRRYHDLRLRRPRPRLRHAATGVTVTARAGLSRRLFEVLAESQVSVEE
jgi:hypothetical protein